MSRNDAAPLRQPASDEAARAAQVLRLLAEPTRLAILAILREGEQSVSELARLAERPVTVASQHLAKLRAGGLVHTDRHGAQIRYSLASEHVADLVTAALHHVEHLDHAVPPHHRAR